MIGLKRRLEVKRILEDWVSRKVELAQTPTGMITVVVGFIIGVMLGKSVL